MKKLIYTSFLLLAFFISSAPSHADWLPGKGMTTVQTADGTTVCTGVSTGIVSNGTLACGNGTATITTGGGGGGSGTVTSVSGANGLSGTVTTFGSISGVDAKADGATLGVGAFNSTNFSDNGSGIINTVQGISSSATPSFAGLSLTGAETITSASANAFSVGLNGATNPALNIDDSTASSVTGIAIKSSTTGNGVSIIASDSGSNTPLTIQSKGTAAVNIGGGASTVVNAQFSGSIAFAMAQKFTTITPVARNGGTTSPLTFTGGVDTGLTTGTEAFDWNLNDAQIKTHANGNITTQRHFLLQAPTDAFTSSASTITDDATWDITGAPNGGTNSTITNSHGLRIESSALTNVTNGYGLSVSAPSGASNNYAAQFTGVVNFNNCAAHSGQAACWSTTGNPGYCTSVVGSGGACTCTPC